VRRQLQEVGARLDKLLESFQVEAAGEGLRDAAGVAGSEEDWIDRQTASIEWVRRLKERLIAAFNGKFRFGAPSFRLRGGPLSNAEVVAADAKRLVVVTEGKMRDVPWSSVDPGQMYLMADAAIGKDLPADRLGLAVYCLRTGKTAEARQLLESLAGTDLEIPAKPFLRELDRN